MFKSTGSFFALTFIAFFLAATAPCAHAGGDAVQPRIAVIPFEKSAAKLKGLFTIDRTIAGSDTDLSEAILQRLTNALFNTKYFNLLERSRIAKIFDEMRLQKTGDFSEESAVALGKMLTAQVIAVGTYTASMKTNPDRNKFSSELDVNVRFIDVQTGRINDILQVSARADAKSATDSVTELLANAAKKMDREAANLYPQTGYVIKVLSPNEAVIDIGRKDGIIDGDEFVFFKVTEDIVHPITKKVMKGERIPLGECSLVSSSAETSIVKSSNNAAEFVVGSSVERKLRKAGLWESVSSMW